MADLGFEGRVAIVTGAGGGLGREHALLLAGRGALVVVNDVGGAVDGTGGDAGPGQQVVDEIAAAGGEAVLDTNSVATPEGGAAIVQTALDSFGRIDIVVNNAGILRDKSFHNMTPDLVDPVIDVHLHGAFYVTQPAWVHMREQSYGRIVVTASSAGHLRQLRPGQLRRRQDGTRGTRPRARPGGRALQHQGQRDRADGRHPHDPRDLRRRAAPTSWRPGSCRRWWRGSSTRTVRSRATPTPSGVARVARIFVAEGPGYLEKDAPLTVEDVRDHFDEIERTDDFTLMRNATDELRVVAKLLG